MIFTCCFFYTACLSAGELSAEPARSSAGYFKLIWSSFSDNAFVLEESSNAEFINSKTIQLRGTNSITLTGLENGSYYYRIKDSNNEWSNVAHVTVEHHSIVKAFVFFSLGLFLFIILVYVLRLGQTNIHMEIE